ncbi:hypothetical protein RFI_10927 [Reticulomyxa filosa]|uniref:Transmembrane protein n=1 Tax=Reticulomyxa filosa TaxID=46433 RepID=X6NJP6_RETFI|nr:hypothetical protein RFI_10927 [Reticulomyxa filosa]|eukprot:ETO26211.1 hypothetical protein RFI_10927 [Reticulomyxa filosa]
MKAIKKKKQSLQSFIIKFKIIELLKVRKRLYLYDVKLQIRRRKGLNIQMQSDIMSTKAEWIRQRQQEALKRQQMEIAERESAKQKAEFNYNQKLQRNPAVSPTNTEKPVNTLSDLFRQRPLQFPPAQNGIFLKIQRKYLYFVWLIKKAVLDARSRNYESKKQRLLGARTTNNANPSCTYDKPEKVSNGIQQTLAVFTQSEVRAAPPINNTVEQGNPPQPLLIEQIQLKKQTSNVPETQVPAVNERTQNGNSKDNFPAEKCDHNANILKANDPPIQREVQIHHILNGIFSKDEGAEKQQKKKTKEEYKAELLKQMTESQQKKLLDKKKQLGILHWLVFKRFLSGSVFFFFFLELQQKTNPFAMNRAGPPITTVILILIYLFLKQ